MGNMSYCRFRNTYGDLRDCREALDNETIDSLSDDEREAALGLIELCAGIADDYRDLADV